MERNETEFAELDRNGTAWNVILEGPSGTRRNVTNFRPDLKAKLWNGTDFGYVSRDGMDWNETK